MLVMQIAHHSRLFSFSANVYGQAAIAHYALCTNTTTALGYGLSIERLALVAYRQLRTESEHVRLVYSVSVAIAGNVDAGVSLST